MHEVDETVDDRIREALRNISRVEADPSSALPMVVARGRARRARARGVVGALALVSVGLPLMGFMLSAQEPEPESESTVATDLDAPVTTEALPAYVFDAAKPLVDRDLPITPRTELAVVDGHVLSAEITADALTYSLTDAAGSGGAASGDPKQLLALTFSGQGPASNDPTPKSYTSGVTRVEVARVDLVRGDDVVSAKTIANDAFPDLRFFIIEDRFAPAGADLGSDVPLLIAYDSQGRVLTNSERVHAAQNQAIQKQMQRQRVEGVAAELHDASWTDQGDGLYGLDVRYYLCGGTATYDVIDDAAAIRIRIMLPAESRCDQDKTLQTVSIMLYEPVGDRKILDDATGQPLSRRTDS